MVFRPFRSARPVRVVTGRIEPLEQRKLLSTTLGPVADADVQSLGIDIGLANLNFGADPSLRVRQAPDETFETFLTFDITSITSIGSATLKLHGGQSAGASEAVAVGAFPTPDEFTEGTGSHSNPLSIIPGLLGVTFNNRPTSAGAAAASANITDVGDYQWDLTSAVNAAKTSGDNLLTIALRQVGGGAGQVTFIAREILGGDNAPLLIIEPDAFGPTATISAPDITTAGGTSQQIVVTYTDTDAIDTATIDAGDIDVRAPGGNALEVTGVALTPPPAGDPGTTVTVTYTVAAPGGAWDSADSAAYAATLKGGAVKDVAGNAATGGPGAFNVAVPQTPPPADTEKPAAQFIDAPPNVSEPGGTGTTVNVRFTDNVGIVADALSNGSLVFTRRDGAPSGISSLDLATTPSNDGKTLDVSFNVIAPGGSWDAADNGTYDVQIVAGAVTDVAGNPSNAATASFTIAIIDAPPPTTDTTGPATAVVPLEPLIEAGGTTQEIRVTYLDDVAVNIASIDVGDIVVTAPDGTPLNVAEVSLSSTENTGSVTATYIVEAPGGAWDVGDDGIYTITLAAGGASDTSGNPSTAATGSFLVAIPQPLPPVDPNFGNSGNSTVNTGFVGEAAVSQPDGKIIIAGRQGDLASGTSQLVLQRLNPDGSLDATFGTGGKVLGATGVNEAAFAIAIQADGTIVVAGRRGNDMLVARFKSNGAIDTRFGTVGASTADFAGGVDVAYSLVIASDGSIVLAGGSTQASGDAFAFARFKSNGAIDTLFGTSGTALFAQGTGGNVAGSVALDTAGRIVAAGPGEGGGVAVVRLDVNGMQDATFGANGILVLSGLATRTDLGRPDRSIGLASQADGSLLVTNHSPDGDFAVARIGADGTPDLTFGTNGIATIDFGGDDDADAILLQGSGEILVLGTTDAGGNKLAVAALSQDGTLIDSFGTGGKLTVDITPVTSARELHLGDLVLRAFGSVTGNGRLVIGASDQAPAAVSSSPLQRLNVPGSGSLGTFGRINGSKKARKLLFQDKDGTVVTISMKGAGSGQAFYDGESLDLVLGSVNNSSLVITTRGGDGRLSLRNVQADGNLKSITGKTTDLVGTFAISNGGGVGKVSLGNLTGTLAASGAIGTMAFAGDVKGKVLSGANYGVNGKPGGAGTAADSFSAGRIGKVTVAGQLIGATFAAGVDPVNQRLLDGNDVLVGGANSSIGSIAVKKGADPSTRFVAGAFAKKVKLPQSVDPLNDPRFMRL